MAPITLIVEKHSRDQTENKEAIYILSCSKSQMLLQINTQTDYGSLLSDRSFHFICGASVNVLQSKVKINLCVCISIKYYTPFQ